MAATKGKLTKLQQEQVRDRIQTTQLVKRLQAYALGLPEPNAKGEGPAPAEIDAGRLKAIEILLRKSLPDLSAQTLDIGLQEDNPIVALLDNIAANGKRITGE